MKNPFLHISALFVFAFNFMQAQTSNEGMLYIAENTEFSTVGALDNRFSGQFFNDGEAFIYSHFNNDGELDFYQETGTTRFIGSNTQNISGTNTSFLYDVLFNNSSSTTPFELAGAINIGGIADFFDGIVDNDNFGGVISFASMANHSNTSDFSHVDGPVNKLGTTAFTFPIGDGGYYRFGGITAPSATEAIFEGKFYFQNSDDFFPHHLRTGVIQEIDNQEYWTIENKGDAQEDVLITLSWRDVTTPVSMIAAAQQESLTIVRWDEAANMWVDEGGAIDLQNQTITTAVKQYGVFTFGRVNLDMILPCNIVVYNAVTPNGDGINDYFLIDTSNNECAEDLNVMVFNRWGVKVFETDNYSLAGDVFDGFSSGRLTMKDSEQLPTGTYYYILDYKYADGAGSKRHKQAGYLYLSGN